MTPLLLLGRIVHLLTITSAAAASSRTIHACPHFTADPRGSLAVPTEDDVAEHGHWGGLKPLDYRINFHFANLTHHNGSMSIDLEAIKTTDKIYLNQDADHLFIDYAKIELIAPCSGKVVNRGSSGCISKITYVSSSQAMVIQFENFRLEGGSKYTLIIPSFHPTKRRYSSMHSLEIRPETGFFARKTAGSAILASEFQPRFARTAHPCMDMVALKSIFHVCIEHPSNLLALSNGRSEWKESNADGTKIMDCFESTPPLSTYLITFALAENFTSKEIEMPGEDFTLEVFYPRDESDERVERAVSRISTIRPSIEHMTRVTGQNFPMSRFGFLLIPQYNGGMEHMGLISAFSRAADLLFLHEMVHQWIGNILTVENWREICLQEGLTHYYALTLRYPEGIPQERTRAENRADFYNHSTTLMMENYLTISDISKMCYGQAPDFFHTITEITGGLEVFERFLARMMEKRAYGNAGIDLWDETMGEVTDGRLDGYIKSINFLFVTTTPDGLISIKQRQKNGSILDSEPPLVVPLSIWTYRGIIPNSAESVGSNRTNIRLTQRKETVHLGFNFDTFLVDPDGHTFSIKVYDSKHYTHLLSNKDKLLKAGVLNEERLQLLIADLCLAVENNVLPFDDGDEWGKVKELVRVHLPNQVHCI